MSNVLETSGRTTTICGPLPDRPMGRPDLCHATTGEIPRSMNELGELVVHAYNLRLAVELNIPVAGSVSGEWDRQVVCGSG